MRKITVVLFCILTMDTIPGCSSDYEWVMDAEEGLEAVLGLCLAACGADNSVSSPETDTLAESQTEASAVEKNDASG